MTKINLLEPKWFVSWLEHTTFTDWLKYLIFDHGKIFNVRAYELTERAREHIERGMSKRAVDNYIAWRTSNGQS